MKGTRQHGTRHVADDATSEIVAYFRTEDLQAGFLKALASACRTGVDVTLRTDVHAFGTDIVDGAEARRLLLEEQIKQVLNREHNAERCALDATTDDERRTWGDRAREARVKRGHLEEALQETPAAPDANAHFSVDMDVIRGALARVATQSRFTQAEYNAFRTVVPTFMLTREDNGTWRARAVLRLPTERGVAEVGPVSWPVPSPARGTHAVRAARCPVPVAASGSRVLLREELTERAGLSPDAANTLTNAPFPELAAIVLHRTVGAVLPDWVGEEWQDDTLGAHLVASYTQDYRSFGRGRYVALSPQRQAVVDVVEQLEPASLADIRRILPGVDGERVWPLGRQGTTGERPWAAILDVSGERDLRATLVRCHCGVPAATLARVPEVPGDLLCPAGHLARGPVHVSLPTAYNDLRVTRAQWTAALPHYLATPISEPSHRTEDAPAELMIVAAAGEAGATSRDVATALGRAASNVHTSLARLEESGLVVREGRYPTRWRVAQ